MSEIYRASLRHINGNYPLDQPPLNIFDVGFQLDEKQRLFLGCGYDGHVVRVDGQLDVVRG